MSTTTATPRAKRELPPLLRLSEGAAERLRSLYTKAESGKILHIGVKTKGCSGLAYDLSFVDQQAPGDERVTDKGVTILVDRKASLYLIGTTMDYEVRPMSAGFVFVNPNEKGRCGCGESFHV
jgi:iron-sulfur cluster assembly protein